MSTQERIVRGGHRGKNRETWSDVFMWESLRNELRATKALLTRLRAAALNWANARGLESEPRHLHALLRELGKGDS